MEKLILKHILILSVIALTFAEQPSFVQRAGKFSIELYKNVVAEHPQENVVISPINCFAALALIYLGSECETFNQMTNGLSLGTNPQAVVSKFRQILQNEELERVFSISSNIFIAEGFETEAFFDQLAADPFGVDLKHINFTNNDAAITQINDWIKQKTWSALSNIVQPNYVIESDTIALILNAVSFKGKWMYQFHQTQSYEGSFWVHGDQKIETTMMSSTITTNFKDFGTFIAITLPYRQTDLMLLVVLPKERYGLSHLEQNLNFTEVFETLNGFESRQRVLVRLPKFKSYFTGELRSPLSKMNLGTVFEESANFNSIGPNVKFNEFIHKMYISMEEGQQKIVFGRPKPSVIFLADHPFLYFIMTPRGIIHTMGRYIGA